MQAGEPCAPGAQGNQRAPRPKPRLSSQLLPEFYTFVARVLFYLAPVYLAGYLGLSITWLLLGALLWMWWRRNRRGKLGRLEAAFEFLDNERQFISRELRGQHLPAWIHFPDVERVEWANKVRQGRLEGGGAARGRRLPWQQGPMRGRQMPRGLWSGGLPASRPSRPQGSSHHQ